MGTVFQVPWTRIGSEARIWPHDGFEVLKGAGFTCSPMAHGVDSLNVAAASAVAFWQLCPHVDNGYHYRPGMFA